MLVRAEPAGPTCHTGRTSCFFEELGDAPDACEAAELGPVLAALTRIVKERARTRRRGRGRRGCWTPACRGSRRRSAKRGVEVALAAAAGSDREVVDEAADLLYHLLVLLEVRNIPPGRVAAELQRRFPAGDR